MQLITPPYPSGDRQGDSTTEREESGQYELAGSHLSEELSMEAKEWPLASLDDWSRETPEWPLALLDMRVDKSFKDADEGPNAFLDESFEYSLYSDTSLSWKGNDVIQRGTNDQLLLETPLSDPPWSDYLATSDFQEAQVQDMSFDPMDSRNIPMREDLIGAESGQHDQERCRSFELESQLKLLRKGQECPQWKNLISNMEKEIAEKIGEIDQESHRRQLQRMKSGANDTSTKLKSTIQKFEGKLKRFLDQLRTVLDNCLNSVPLHTIANPGQQQLIRRISQVVESFSFIALRNLSLDTTRIAAKLDRLEKQLGARELSALILFQNCASSIYQKVESFLGEQSANFISVADFSNWYRNELYNPPRSRRNGENAMSS